MIGNLEGRKRHLLCDAQEMTGYSPLCKSGSLANLTLWDATKSMQLNATKIRDRSEHAEWQRHQSR